MHEEERPAVGNLCVGPEEYALEFERRRVFTRFVGVVETSLCITVKLYAADDVVKQFLTGHSG